MPKSQRRRAPWVDLLEPRRLFAALTPGLTVSSTIAAPSEVDSYTISLTAGQTLVVALGDSGLTAFDPQVELHAPGGGVVRTDSNETGVFYTTTASTAGT